MWVIWGLGSARRLAFTALWPAVLDLHTSVTGPKGSLGLMRFLQLAFCTIHSQNEGKDFPVSYCNETGFAGLQISKHFIKGLAFGSYDSFRM